MAVHVTVLRAMTPCTLIHVYRRFEPEYKGSASLGGVRIAGSSDHDSVSRPTVGTVEGSLTCYLNATSHFPLRLSGAPTLSSPDLLSHLVPLKYRRSEQWKTEGVWRHHGSRIDVMLTPWLHVLWLVMTTHLIARRLHSTGCKGVLCNVWCFVG